MQSDEPNSHVHASPDELLEFALDAQAVLPLGWASCASCKQNYESWRRVVQDLRTQFKAAQTTEAASTRLSAEILARTTREDLSWRGDLGLVRRFVQSRLGARSWSKVAAALLVVQLFALPLLALVLRQPQRLQGFFTGIQPAAKPWPVEPEHPLDNLPDPPTADLQNLLPEVLELHPSVEDGLQWARARLNSLDLEPFELAARTPLGQSLAARALWLKGRGAPPAAPGQAAGAVELALYLEHLLDRFALESEPRVELRTVLAKLWGTQGVSRAGERLLLASLCRARDYGLLDPLDQERLEHALTAAGIHPQLELPFTGGLRSLAPVDSSWLALLEAALEPSVKSEPAVQAWLGLRDSMQD